MTDNPISFPGIGLTLNPDRVAFTVFGREIYWYGVIIALGFLLAVIYGLRNSRRFGVDPDKLLDGILIITPIAVICARLYYVIFSWEYYRDNPVSALYIWDGGLAIYGGIIAIVLGVFIYGKVRKISWLAILDVTVIPVIMAQGIGRWGNFFNREAFGTVTDLPWRMEIYVAEAGARQCVHPTFLYESLACLIGFVLLHLLSKKRKFDGQIFLAYVMWYGFFRGLIEGLRTDSLYLIPGVIRVSQALGFASALVALGFTIWFCSRKTKTLTPPYQQQMEENKMRATVIDGKLLAQQQKEKIRAEVSALKEQGIQPGLAVILVGENPASQVYVRNKKKDCEQCGITSFSYDLPETTTQQELLDLIRQLNENPEVHGILVQLPLPEHLDEKEVIHAIHPDKDVDAFHPENVGKIMLGEETFLPCTPAGVMEMLDEYHIDPKGKECVVVGRSNIVGKPMAMLLLHRHGTVTIAHSRTPDLAEVTRRADILVVAVGKENLITRDMVKPGAVVIDVAINRGADGKLHGDVAYEEVSKTAGYITPVPGGVGPMTRVMLLKNTLRAARIQAPRQ